MPEDQGYLRVKGTDVVDENGNKVILKGAATGGHTNMENFITGYPGHEHEMRKALLEVLGKEKYDFFFDKVSCGAISLDNLSCSPPYSVPRVLLHFLRRQVLRITGPELSPHSPQPQILHG